MIFFVCFLFAQANPPIMITSKQPNFTIEFRFKKRPSAASRISSAQAGKGNNVGREQNCLKSKGCVELDCSDGFQLAGG